jgi:undecaprenyl diphosphate synthase
MPYERQPGINNRRAFIVPDHIAIIMDGNGRWAEQRGLPRLDGHRIGTEKIHEVVRLIAQHQVSFLTLYAFSTENWTRPKNEIQGLMNILEGVILREVDSFDKQEIKLNHLGRMDRLSPKLRRGILNATKRTERNKGMTLNVAFDYGGREDILQAVRKLLAARIPPDEVTESLFQDYLYTNSIPDPDLIIRTGGEMRMSNFLLWQAAYSEYYSTPVLWPDIDENEILKAIESYGQRQRRFGGLYSSGEDE